MGASHAIVKSLSAGQSSAPFLIRTEFPPYKFSVVGDFSGGPVVIEHSPDAGIPQSSNGRWITIGSVAPGGGDLDVVMPLQNVRARSLATSGSADVYFIGIAVI
jgi:hypothetical protein